MEEEPKNQSNIISKWRAFSLNWIILSHMLIAAVKWAAAILRSIILKSEEGQNWGNAAKESILPAAGTVLIEAANSAKHGGSGKKKRKKLYKSSARL